MPNTIYEFWLMVYQNALKNLDALGNCQKIAMLTDIIENSRQKCAIYFPEATDKTMVFSSTGNQIDNDYLQQYADENLFNETLEECPILKCNYFCVKNMDNIVRNGYSIRKLCVVYLNRAEQQDHDAGDTGNRNCFIVKAWNNKTFVYHYWFPDWPDHRSPEDIDVLLDMSLDLLDGRPQNQSATEPPTTVIPATNDQPIIPLPIIHCSAGIGRTGCLAAILNGLRQMRTSIRQHASSASSTLPTMTVDVLGIVCNLRLQRGGMVQNSEQYELIHRALCLYQRRLGWAAKNHEPESDGQQSNISVYIQETTVESPDDKSCQK